MSLDSGRHKPVSAFCRTLSLAGTIWPPIRSIQQELKIERFAVAMNQSLQLPTPVMAERQRERLKLYKVWTSYDALRQGNSFEMKLRFKSRRCILPLEVDAEPALHRMSLELQPGPGLALRLIGRSFDHVDCSPSGMSWSARGLVLILRVSASSELTPGNHKVSAVLEYAALDRKGEPSTCKLFLTIPVRVVPATGRVKEQHETRPRKPWSILLLPVRLLETILFWDGS